MPTPIGWDTREPLCGENDPLGREDTANKYAKTLWQNFTAEHNPDGTHKTGSLCLFETGRYTGNGMAGRVITTRNPAMTIRFLRITPSYQTGFLYSSAIYLLNASSSMTAGNAKRTGTAAFNTNAVTALNTGSFVVGGGQGINYQNVQYYWEAYGSGTVGTPRSLTVAVKTSDNAVQNDIQSNGPTLAGIVTQYGGATGDYQLIPIAADALNSRNITYNGSAFTIITAASLTQSYLLSAYQSGIGGTDSTFSVKAGWAKGNARLAADVAYDIRTWPAADARNYRIAFFQHNTTGVIATTVATSAMLAGQPSISLTDHTYMFDIINSQYQYHSAGTPPWFASFAEDHGYW